MEWDQEVQWKSKEEEEQLTPEEIRGKRRKRLTMKMVDSPLIKKKSKRKSGSYDVEEKGRMNDGLDISLVEPVLEPGKEKAIKMRQSAAKESFGKKGKTSKASGKREKHKRRNQLPPPRHCFSPPGCGKPWCLAVAPHCHRRGEKTGQCPGKTHW